MTPRLLLFLLLTTLGTTRSVRAQQPTPPLPASSRFVPDSSAYAGLTRLPGRYPFQVRVSGTPTPRARATADRLARAYEYYFDLLLFRPNAAVLFLSADDHQRRYPRDPYGLPFYRDGNLVLPAGPSPLQEQLAARARALTNDTAAHRRIDAWLDLLAVQELTYAFSGQSIAVSPPRRFWLDGFFASLLHYAYFAELEPKLLPAVETLPALIASRDTTRYPHRTLAAFADDWFEPLNYAWYLSQLSTHAKAVYRAGGSRAARRLYVFLRSNPKRTLLVADEKLALRLQTAVSPQMADVIRKWPVK